MPRADRCFRANCLNVTGAALAAVFAIAAIAPPAAAVNRSVAKACKSDYKRLCPRYRVGTSKLRRCMEAKQAEISWRCIEALIDSGEVDRGSRRRR
ncbi:MAG: hypothetical protein AB7O43_22310 [Hyphomicrobiaceae bacterium]